MTKKTPRRRHVPLRTCVVCRQKTDKRRLVRIVHTPDEGVVIDPTGKRNGRGAYLCDRADCWHRALSTPVLGQALGRPLSEAEKAAVAAGQPRPAVTATANAE